jgi:D-alanine-D-alanine ligase
MRSENPGVLVLYNVPRSEDSAGKSPFAESEAGVLAEVRAVTEAMAKLGTPHRVVGVRRLSDLPGVLAGARERVVFNLVESLRTDAADANLVPTVCRAFGKACTGGDTPCLMLAMDKWQSRTALVAHGLACPAAAVVPVGQKVRPSVLPAGRLIVKPAACDGSEGIDPASVVDGPGPDLARAVRRVHEQLGQPALVEQFVGRRELNVTLLQRGGRLETLPLAEIDFSAFAEGKLRIVDYAAKWLSETFEYRNTPTIIPAPLEEKVARRVRQSALVAWRALGCQDYARVDFRLNDDGRAFILDVNPNPDVSPDAGFAAALVAAGIPYEDFVGSVVRNADSRLAGKTSRDERG